VYYQTLFFLVAVGSSTLLSFVRGYLMPFSFFTAWHSSNLILNL